MFFNFEMNTEEIIKKYPNELLGVLKQDEIGNICDLIFKYCLSSKCSDNISLIVIIINKNY